MAKKGNRKKKVKNQGFRAKANRQYKSTLFAMIFSGKEELLELFNAVNGSHYTDPDELEIVTLENAVYMSFHNDISFILDMRVYLYEHQSTVNPNMPLRFLEYVADQYAGLVDAERIYGSKVIPIPAPRFVIFYNGAAYQPDRQILRLSDMYKTKEDHPALELEAIMLNVNLGHNQKLMEASKTLAGYAEYTDRVRRYREVMTLEDAVDRAVDECIREGILADFLKKNRAEAIRMSLYDYTGFDREKYEKMEREYAYEDGHEAGRTEGMFEAVADNISKFVSKGFGTPDEVMDTLDIPESEREKYRKAVEEQLAERKA